MDSIEKKRVVHILWTGGLESTYRVVELSRTDCVIQPHYIIVKELRKNHNYELKAIQKITEILKRDERTKATFLPPIIFNEQKELEEYPDISEAWYILESMKNCTSRQYQVLSRYARQENLKLEMGIQFSPHGSIGRAIDTSFLVEHPIYHDIMMIDPKKEQEDWASYTVFQYFHFPKSLFHKDKSEEARELIDNGYGEVLKNIWSCHNPIFGMACGHCGPCRSAKAEGTGYMIPFMGNLLGAVRWMVLKILTTVLRKILPPKLYNKLKRLVRRQTV